MCVLDKVYWWKFLSLYICNSPMFMQPVWVGVIRVIRMASLVWCIFSQ